MASGREHTKTAFIVGSFGVSIGIIGGSLSFGMMGLGCLFAGYFCSPDMDVTSLPYNRWGIFRILWRPYRDLLPHRSFWSHTPAIGTAIRVAYCLTLWHILLMLFPFVPSYWPLLSYSDALAMFNEHGIKAMQYAPPGWLFILGMALNDTLHWFQDGCPL